MKLLGSVFILIACLFSSCGSSDRMSDLKFDETNALEEKGVKLIPILTEMEGESLGLVDYQYSDKSGKASLRFDADLSDEVEIRYSINNGQLAISHKNEFEIELLEGNNVLVAFLALKDGVRVPPDSSAFIRNFYIGKGESGFESQAPHLFHCFPEEVDSANFMMDFYLNNASQIKGLQVRLIIDGIRFTVPYAQSFKIVGLSKETHNVRIQLLDQNGKFVPGPFNDSGVKAIKIT